MLRGPKRPKKERTVAAPPKDWLTAAGAAFFGNVPGERHDSDRQERANLFILNHYLFAASEAVGAPTKEGYKRRATDFNIRRQ